MRDKINGELLLVSFCTISMIGMLATVLLDYHRISIEKLYPAVDFEWTEPTKAAPEFPRLDFGKDAGQTTPCKDAKVEWSYTCATQMDYSLLEQQKTGNKWLARIKIDSVHARLWLPIKTILPENAITALKEHEIGHVEICKRVYEDSDKFARAAIEMVLKRTYSGEGDTLDEAISNAVKMAGADINNEYQPHTQAVAQDVSEIYDFLQLKKGATPEQSIEEAFETYKSGKPRRL